MKLKRPTDSLNIDCILGVNCLYTPMAEGKFVSKVDSFPVTLKIPKTDKKTVALIAGKFNDHAKFAVNDPKAIEVAQKAGKTINLKTLINDAKDKKFVDGDHSEYESEHGYWLLRCNCYEQPPATGIIEGDRVRVEKIPSDEIGRTKGNIRAGDQVKACCKIYYNKDHRSLQAKVHAVYLVEKGLEGGTPSDIAIRHKMAMAELKLQEADPVDAPEFKASPKEEAEWDKVEPEETAPAEQQVSEVDQALSPEEESKEGALWDSGGVEEAKPEDKTQSVKKKLAKKPPVKKAVSEEEVPWA